MVSTTHKLFSLMQYISRFEILLTSLSNTSSNILQILSYLGADLMIREKASVFSYPGYTETVKYQIAKNCYWCTYKINNLRVVSIKKKSIDHIKGTMPGPRP